MLTPTLAGRSLVAAIAANGRRSTVGGRAAAVAALITAIDLSAARGDFGSEVRLCSACAYVPCMTCALTLTNPYYIALTATTPH